MFKKILIANRGEIACRVIRTAQRLGISTVAVYSEADENALHVAMADEAVNIGPAPSAESYLDIARVVAACRQSGAQAVHPGYGFLSENADFARACARSGVAFIGPDAKAIEAMGNKAAAKAMMERVGVPVVPGYHGEKQGKALRKAARMLGFPLLIKAASGGGGRGMRIVRYERELRDAIAGAQREAEAAFGDDRLILEQYLNRPRHVEVQIFADRHGNVIHLFTRDCSLQRRHQKVIEEAPAPDLPPSLRRAIHAAAIKAARAVDYAGAGTVEFMLAEEKFYFIEMNTRLQVEHPVTELVTGLDLVEWQFRVAWGEKLPLRQDRIALKGHAIEARLYAEDPARGFIPSPGTLARLRLPHGASDLRVETGVRQGDCVTEFYDPMIAKLASWGKTRAMTLARLGAALAETRILGLATNRDFLLRVVKSRAFAAGPADTGFIERHRRALLPESIPAPETALAAASLSRLLAVPGGAGGDRYSPWRLHDGWQLTGEGSFELRFDDNGKPRPVRIGFGAGALRLHFGRSSAEALAWSMPGGDLAFTLGRKHVDAAVLWRGNEATVALAEGSWRLNLADPKAKAVGERTAPGRLSAPMPGKIGALLVERGDKVKRGQILLVLEAMKMEHAVASPADGVVAELHCAAGDSVGEGAALLSVIPAGPIGKRRDKEKA
jgi:3-methylcrotonyl-CoA carboxylase alpha subunit